MPSVLPWVLPVTLGGPDPVPAVPATVVPNAFVGSQAQRWLQRQRNPGYTPANTQALATPAAAIVAAPATVTANLFVGSQAQRWLARQHAPAYTPAATLAPVPPPAPVDFVPTTLVPNLLVGSQAQRWIARQHAPDYAPVDSPGGYILPTTPPGGGVGLVVRGGYGFVGIAAGDPDGVYWRMAQFTYQTDSQYIAIVLGDEGGAAAEPTVLYFHCDPSFTRGAFLSISYTGFTLGSFTRSGNTINYVPFNNGSVSMLILSAQTVGVQNVNNAYTVTVNGQPLLEFTGGSVSMGAGFRNAAVSMSRFTDGGGFIWDSYRLAALSLADYVQPVHTGTGARISRNSLTGIAPVLTIAGTPALLANNTFDTIDVCTADIIVDLSTNKMTFLTAGYYIVKICLYSANPIRNGSTVASAVAVLLAKNGALYEEDQTYLTSINNINSIRSVSGTFLIDVNVNDYIQPGNDNYYADLTGFSIVGPSAYSYMGVSLLNKKV